MELSLLEDLVFPVLREILSTKGGVGNGKFFVSCGHYCMYGVFLRTQ